MNVLHLFSNSRWTGPAEPALNLCLSLRRRGISADFACSPGPAGAVNKIVETARDRDIEPILKFGLSKHKHPIRNLLDSRALGRFLQAHPYDIIHCHLDNDHRIAAGPAGKLGVRLVRSSYEGGGLPVRKEAGGLLARTDFLIEPSEQARQHDLDAFGFPAERTRVVPGAVDVERFDPAREVPDGRRWLGIPHDAFVVGIVARMQRHRHYRVLFEAMRALVERVHEAHLIVVGRGTRQEEVGKQPVKELGLERNVHFPGYVDGENYVGMLRAFDVKVFLVPGSDGTCRAVREVMAMARPVVVAERGMLPEIVDDGETGFVFDGSPDALTARLASLAENRALRRAMGRAAREKAIRLFSLEVQAEGVHEVYEALM